MTNISLALNAYPQDPRSRYIVTSVDLTRFVDQLTSWEATPQRLIHIIK
jgi:hypothetical protein